MRAHLQELLSSWDDRLGRDQSTKAPNFTRKRLTTHRPGQRAEWEKKKEEAPNGGLCERDDRRQQIEVNKNEMKIKLIPHIVIYTKCRLAIFIHIFFRCLLFVYLFICLTAALLSSFFSLAALPAYASLFICACIVFFLSNLFSHFTFAVATSPTSAMYHSFYIVFIWIVRVFFFAAFFFRCFVDVMLIHPELHSRFHIVFDHYYLFRYGFYPF